MTTNKVKTMVIAALLCAIGIIIPQYSPIRIVIEPASFTLGSHIAVFIAMFISPAVAVSVALVTSLGFLIAGFLPVIVLRALSHVIFAAIGALILKKNQKILLSIKTMIPFALLIAVIHAVAEVIVSSIFYFNGNVTKSYLISVIGLVGLGTIVHSLVDFSIAVLIWKPLQYVVSIPVNAKVRVRAR